MRPMEVSREDLPLLEKSPLEESKSKDDKQSMKQPCEFVNLEAPLEMSKEVKVLLEECIEDVIHDDVLDADSESPMVECVVNIDVPKNV